ncbi:MAG: hypothetical protein FJ290_15330 [Planctomycetes bacterium]|nr:hypothetical protein [Planctomycetota bacterium]
MQGAVMLVIGPVATLAGWPLLARMTGVALGLARHGLDMLALNLMAVMGGIAGLLAGAAARGVRVLTLWSVARAFLLDRVAAGGRRARLVARTLCRLVARQRNRRLPRRHAGRHGAKVGAGRWKQPR